MGVLESVCTSRTMQQPRNRSTRIRDQQNSASALEKVLAHAGCGSSTTRIDFCKLQEWHQILMGDAFRAGQFRTSTVAKCGTRTFTRPGQVETALSCLINQMDDSLMLFGGDRSIPYDPAAHVKAAYVCYHFVRIHPFSDGNGRMARLMLLWTLRRCGLPLLIGVCAPGDERSEF